MTTSDPRLGLDVRPATTLIGAEIHGVDLSRPLDPATVADIRAALLRWRVVFFRDQDITPEQHVVFGRSFGAVTPAHPVGGGVDGFPEVLEIGSGRPGRRLAEAGLTDPLHEAEVRDPAWGWHTDITFVQNPALGSILKAVVIPPYGGDTGFANLVAAYQGLSEEVRRFIDGLRAVHKWHFGRFGRAREDGPPPEVPAPAAVHPVVRVHPETGEKGLFVNPRFTRYIVGLSTRESDAVLHLLYGQLGRPEYQVRFRWQPGSIAFWDNRATAHLAAVDMRHSDYERRLHRITLAGDVPVGPTGFRSEVLVGDPFGAAAAPAGVAGGGDT